MNKNGKNNEPTNNDVISEIKGEFKRHTNILMEQMKHEVKTVAEGHGAIMRKLEEHDKKFAKVEVELQSISMTVMEISHDTKGHEKRIKKIEEKLPENWTILEE